MDIKLDAETAQVVERLARLHRTTRSQIIEDAVWLLVYPRLRPEALPDDGPDEVSAGPEPSPGEPEGPR